MTHAAYNNDICNYKQLERAILSKWTWNSRYKNTHCDENGAIQPQNTNLVINKISGKSGKFVLYHQNLH